MLSVNCWVRRVKAWDAEIQVAPSHGVRVFTNISMFVQTSLSNKACHQVVIGLKAFQNFCGDLGTNRECL